MNFIPQAQSPYHKDFSGRTISKSPLREVPSPNHSQHFMHLGAGSTTPSKKYPLAMAQGLQKRSENRSPIQQRAVGTGNYNTAQPSNPPSFNFAAQTQQQQYQAAMLQTGNKTLMAAPAHMQRSGISLQGIGEGQNDKKRPKSQADMASANQQQSSHNQLTQSNAPQSLARQLNLQLSEATMLSQHNSNSKSQQAPTSARGEETPSQQLTQNSVSNFYAGAAKTSTVSEDNSQKDLEVRLKMLCTENETLTRYVADRGRELKKSQEEQAKLEENLRRLLAENEKLNQLVQSKEGECGNSEQTIHMLSEQIKRLSEQSVQESMEKEKIYGDKVRELHETLLKYEEKIDLMVQENGNLNDLLNQRINEDEQAFEHLRRLCEEKDAKLGALLEQQQQQHTGVAGEVRRVAQVLAAKERELQESQEVLQDFDRKITVLLEENEKLNEIVQTQEQQRGDYEQKIARLCTENEKLVGIIDSGSTQQQQIVAEQRTALLAELKQEFSKKMQDELRQMRQTVDAQLESKARASNQLEERLRALADENEALRRENEDAGRVVCELQARVQDANDGSECESLVQKCIAEQNETLLEENAQLSKLAIERLQEIERLQLDVLAKNQRLIALERDAEALKRQLYEHERRSAEAQTRLARAENSNQQLRAARDALKEEVQKLCEVLRQRESVPGEERLRALRDQGEEWRRAAEARQIDLNIKCKEAIDKDEEIAQLKQKLLEKSHK